MPGKTSSFRDSKKKKSFKAKKIIMKETTNAAMAGKTSFSRDSKKKSFKAKKSILKGTTNAVRTMMRKFLRSLKPRKVDEEVVPVEDLENRLTQMLSASTNDLLNLDGTMTGIKLLTPRAQRHVLRL